MKKAFTEEELKAWRALQPQKMVAAKVVIKSTQGNFLTVKPTYKETWQLPGGGVDDGEGPEAAVIREVAEEIGITISENDLIPKGTIYKQDQELLLVMFESKILVDESTHISLENDFSGYQFASSGETALHLADYYLDFWDKHYGTDS